MNNEMIPISLPLMLNGITRNKRAYSIDELLIAFAEPRYDFMDHDEFFELEPHKVQEPIYCLPRGNIKLAWYEKFLAHLIYINNSYIECPGLYGHSYSDAYNKYIEDTKYCSLEKDKYIPKIKLNIRRNNYA
jgi:hypothetical protein